MKNSNGKVTGLFSSGRGARIIFGLICLCLIGGLMIYSFQNALDRNAAETETVYETPETDSEPDLSVSSNIPVTDSAAEPANKQDDAASGENSGSNDLSVMPAEGSIIRDYSGSGLVFSETLNQYLAHKAVDIGAPVGTAVVAAESGTVLSVDEDDRYGLTVTISHGDGLETSYACLDEASVAAGDVVNRGDRVGTVGEGALFESADDPHLHFAVHKNGEAVNPHDIWNW